MPREYEWIVDPASGETDTHRVTLPSGSISACLVVYHEGALIERCLSSLAGVVDEVIVVHDGPCGDDTLDIAKRFGCRVFERPRYGHCERHMPFAYQQSCGEWLLTLDADEFLSDDLRARLRSLVTATDVDGYELLWPLWNGRRYVSRNGPYKLALTRRAAFRMVGIIHSKGEVDGTVRRVPYHLEHQPPYNNFSVRMIASKWRVRARLQAREYLTDLQTVPRFNYTGTLRWTRRRLWANRWAPLLVLPAACHTFMFVVRDLAGEVDLMPRIRFALTQALYRGMVATFVARERRRV